MARYWEEPVASFTPPHARSSTPARTTLLYNAAALACPPQTARRRPGLPSAIENVDLLRLRASFFEKLAKSANLLVTGDS